MRWQIFFPLITDTFQKEYRNKSLITFSIMTLVIVLSLNWALKVLSDNILDQVMLAELVKRKLIFYYFMCGFWSSMLACLMGTNCLRTDFDHQVLQQLLSFPIKKHDYIIARILGTWLIVMIQFFLAVLLAQILFSLTSHQWFFSINLFQALAVSGLSLLALVTLGSLISIFVPRAVAFLILIFVNIGIHMANSIFISEGKFSLGINISVKPGIFLTTFHYLFPRLGIIDDISQNILLEKVTNFSIWPQLLHYGASYFIILGLIIFIYHKKNLV